MLLSVAVLCHKGKRWSKFFYLIDMESRQSKKAKDNASIEMCAKKRDLTIVKC